MGLFWRRIWAIVFFCALCSPLLAGVEPGSIPGTFDVSLAGSSSYSVPIKIPPGAGGTQPQLHLRYDSQSLGGSIGAGWSLQGLSAITRGPKDQFVDGNPGGINLDDNDALYLDGQRIVPVEAPTGMGADRRLKYRKINDDYTEILQLGADLNHSLFRVRTKGGVTLILGSPKILQAAPPASELDATIRFADGSVMAFAESAAIDTAGNFITFRYQSNGLGDYNISEIQYTGHGKLAEDGSIVVDRKPFAGVSFSYEFAPHALEVFVGGQLLRKDQRLTDIASCVFPMPVDRSFSCAGPVANSSERLQTARYKLEYTATETANRFVLSTLRMFGADNATEVAPTKFNYYQGDPGWRSSPFQLPDGLVLAETERLGAAYRFVHFAPTNNGALDLLFSAQIAGKNVAFAFKNNGAGSWVPGGSPWTSAPDFAPPVPFVSADGSDLGVILADITGNGRIAIIQSYKAGQQTFSNAYLAGGTKFEPSPEYKIPFLVSKDGAIVANYRFGSWTGGAGPDLIFESEGSRGFLRNGGPGTGWVRDDRYVPPVSLDNRTLVVDWKCVGGDLALVRAEADPRGQWVWRVYRYRASGWEEDTRPEFKPPFAASTNPEAIRQIRFDTNASGCAGLIIATAENGGVHKSFVPVRTGWNELTTKAPPFDLVDKNGQPSKATVVALKGNGYQGILANTVLPDGSSTAFAYGLNPLGWEDLSASFVPEARLVSTVPNAPKINAYVGPLTGTGRDDIVILNDARILYGSSDAERNRLFGRIFTNDSTKFVEQTQFAPPLAFARQDKQDLGVRFIDLHGTGLPDVIFSRLITRGGKKVLIGGAYRNTGRGWIAEPGQCETEDFDISADSPPLKGGLCPPIPFSGADLTGNPTQFVDLDGDGYLDLVYSYRNRTNKVVTKILFNVDDGNGGRKWEDASSNPAKLAQYKPPDDVFPISAADVGDQGVRFVKIDSHRIGVLKSFRVGQQDCLPFNLCFPVPGVHQKRAYVFDGQRWVTAPHYEPPIPFVTQFDTPTGFAIELFVQTTDVTGSGLPSIAANYVDPVTGQATNKVWTNSGQGWDANNSISIPYAFDAIYREPKTLVQLTDVNGDGLPDVVMTKGACAGCARTWLGTGKGWIDEPRWRIPSEAIADKDGDPGFRLVDTKGDGYVDLLWIRQLQDGTISKGLLLNDGGSWTKRASSEVVPDLPFADKDGVDQGVRLLSVTGKGLTDIVQSFEGRTQSIQLNRSRRADILKSLQDGYGLTTELSYQTLLEVDAFDPGSGIVEAGPLGWRTYEREVSDPYPKVAPIPTSYVVRRASVNEGNGRVTALSYRYGKYRVDAEATRPLGFGWRESLNEVTGILVRNEMVQDARARPGQSREATCWVDQAILKSLIRSASGGSAAAFPSNLCPDGLGTILRWGKKLAETQSCWTIFEGDLNGRVNDIQLPASPMCGDAIIRGPLSGAIIRQSHLTLTRQITYELDGRLVTAGTNKFELDTSGDILSRNGNVLSTTSALDDGTTIETANEYQDDRKRWYLGRLTKSTVKKYGDPIAGPGSPRRTEARCSRFEYDRDTGLLAEQESNGANKQATLTKFERDRYGNIVKKVVSAIGERAQITSAEFDQFGRFEIASTDGLGHRSEATKDPRTGLPTTLVDANGLRTSFQYDTFGRLRSETSPTGISKTTEMVGPGGLPSLDSTRDIAFGLPVRVSYAIRTQVGPLPPSWLLFDTKGRPLREVTNGFTADVTTRRFIFRDVVYDSAGRAFRSSMPYEAGGTPRWTTNDYDELGRICASVGANGVRTETVFSALEGGGARVEVVVDPTRQLSGPPMLGDDRPTLACGRTFLPNLYRDRGLNQVTASRLNMRKQIVESIDAKGSVKFSYDAGGRLLVKIGPTGAVTRNEYNELGNKVSVRDPDFGEWHYKFDPFGRAVQQTDAKGQRSVVEYDAIGRPSRRVVGDVTTTWLYDSAAHGVGKLAAVSTSNGYKEELFYDSYGRVIGQAAVIEREQFYTATEYDRFSRITKTVYPSSFAVRNKYDAKGFLVAVENESESKTLWRAEQIDVMGRVEQEWFGNGVTTTKKYDPVNQRLHQISAAGSSGNGVLDLSLEYDVIGNLKSRSERVDHKRESFDYDEINRLVAFVSHGEKEEYRYDAAGRFRYKAGVGHFQYADTDGAAEAGEGRQNGHPFHGVTATVHHGHTHHYKYDQNGSVISAPQGHFEYTADNHLQLMYLNERRWTRFDYGPNGDRFRQFLRHGDRSEVTLYVGLFERVIEYGLSKNSDFLYPSKFSGFARFVKSRHYIRNQTGMLAVVETEETFANTELFERQGRHVLEWHGKKLVSDTSYLHTDQLGSVVRVTNHAGRIAKRSWYNPWGGREDSFASDATKRKLQNWSRGYTGHEHIDTFAVIHMNGRVYNPALGLFLSADPIDRISADTQSGNGYTYVRNNPLRYIDPTGYDLFGDIGDAFSGGLNWLGRQAGAVWDGIKHFGGEVGKWWSENWRTVVVIVVVAVVTYFTLGAGTPEAITLGDAILAGAAAGAAGGAVGTALYGGSPDDIVQAAIKGAIIGAISGAAFYGIGQYFGPVEEASASSQVQSVAAHGVVGGAKTAAEGGDFWKGFVATAATKAAYVYGPKFHSFAANAARAAVVGGTVAELSGEKFANGAITGVFSFAFNDWLHRAKTTAVGAGMGAAAGAVAASAACDIVSEGLCIPANAITAEAGAAAGTVVGGALGWVYGALGDAVQATIDVYNQLKNPFEGTPGSSVTIHNPDGTPKQTRTYAPDGYPAKDIDYNHDHGQGKPHVHDWTRPDEGRPPTSENRQPGRPPKPNEK
jgi:RHS repeat-associated protein